MCRWERARALKFHNCSSRVIFLVMIKSLVGLLFMITGCCGLSLSEAAVAHSGARVGVSPGFAFLDVLSLSDPLRSGLALR